jgi:uncharacterized protein (TIGR02266 family)
MEERRQACPRIETHIKIAFQDSRAPVSSYFLNLSSGGIFIKTDNPAPVDSILSLLLHMPGDLEPLNIQGRVVRIKKHANSFPAGMGIQFIDIPPLHKERIQAFVDSKYKNPE